VVLESDKLLLATNMGCSSSKEASPAARLPVYPLQGDENYAVRVVPSVPRYGGHKMYFRERKSPAPEIPPSQQAKTLSLQPPRWPKIIKVEGFPILVYILSHTRWAPGGGTVPCWTYVSSGLHAVDQPEIVMTIGRRPNEDLEDWSTMPIEWTRILYQAAKNDHVHVDAHQMVEIFFQDPFKVKVGGRMYEGHLNMWQGFHRLGMLVHVENSGDHIDLPPLPYPSHHVIALTHNEAAIAKEFGVHRVLSRLAVHTECFPIPPWIDRDRSDVTRMADNAGTIHVTAPVPRARVYGVSAIIADNGDIVLRIPADAVKRRAFQEHVARTDLSDGLSFESFLPWDADSMWSWKSGNTDPEIISKGGKTRMTCTSLAFLGVGLQDRKDECIMVEDGYCLIVTTATSKRIRDAIAAGTNFDLELFDKTFQKKVRFCLRWRREEMDRPPLVWQNMVGGAE